MDLAGLLRERPSPPKKSKQNGSDRRDTLQLFRKYPKAGIRSGRPLS